MKKTLTLVAAASALTLSFSSCQKKGCTDPTALNYSETAKKDDGSCVYAPGNEVVITDNITSNTTWTNDKIWILGARVAVTNGATLTIEPGTVIKGQAGTGPNATALIIARNAKINAVGTATAPIIFTSIADEIQPGQIASPNLDPTLSGLWGGLIVLGNAPISADAAEMQIEGIPASDPSGLYGGTTAADNSGTLKFVSIRHGGANIGEGNEINGLTLGGVGSGTTVENIEIVANQDDGVEFFGGTVTVKNILVWNVGDDCFDTDQAFAGTIDNFVGICGSATDHGLEIDGPEGTMLAGHTVMNGTIKGSSVAELGDFRASALGSFSNIYFFNFPDPTVAGRGDLSLSSGSDVTYAAGDLTFSNLQTTLPAGISLSQVFLGGTDVHASDVALGANTVGANTSAFASWTWASVNGALNF